MKAQAPKQRDDSFIEASTSKSKSAEELKSLKREGVCSGWGGTALLQAASLPLRGLRSGLELTFGSKRSATSPHTRHGTRYIQLPSLAHVSASSAALSFCVTARRGPLQQPATQVTKVTKPSQVNSFQVLFI